MRRRLGSLTPQQEEALEASRAASSTRLRMGRSPSCARQAAEARRCPHAISAIRKAVPTGGRMIVIGSRGSQLALWQANHISARLAGLGAKLASKSSRPPATRSPTCLWPRWAARVCSPRKSKRRCWTGRIDLAVHSLKDLPTELPAGLVLSAIPEREDPRDASDWQDASAN